MPPILAMINKKLRTPIPAVIFTCLIAIGYLFAADRVYVLINASQVTIWLAIFVVTLALFALRWKMPNAPRPVKVSSPVCYRHILIGTHISLMVWR
ncbi:hypothetical protein GCK32_001302 [Trichostrongylus colubriformis]|uniref:Uncharacterized protein n=1 Tax=Trichostrongylus colubriformis TaxID=6319 RepID=A0AAN8J2L2_TRICO